MSAKDDGRQYEREMARLKKSWLRELQRSYQHIAGPLQPELKPASLGLMKGKRVWGRWSERERTILISEELIANHPWPAVEGILGHEIIHQAVSELGGPEARREPPHGPAFQKLGAARGLHPFYLKASVDLMESCPAPLDDQDQTPSPSAQVMAKVRKLLALSGSPVLAEAQAAMNAAARLMARHNLEMLDSPPEQAGYEYRTIELNSSRVNIRSTLIAGILGRHFFVQCIFTGGYDAARDRESKCLELLGRPENIRLAEHVYRYLEERTESLWREYQNSGGGRGLVARNSFIIGLLEAFGQKLDEAAAASADLGGGAEGFSALVLARDSGLKDYFKRRYPYVRNKRSGRRLYNPDAASAGQAAGRALNINRPLEKTAPAKPPETRLLKAGR